MQHNLYTKLAIIVLGLLIVSNKNLAQFDETLLQAPAHIKKIAKQIQNLNLDPNNQPTITARRNAKQKLNHLQNLVLKMQQTVGKANNTNEFKTIQGINKKSLPQDLVKTMYSLSKDTQILINQFNTTDSKSQENKIKQALQNIQNICLRMENITNPKQEVFPLEAGTWDAGFNQEKEAVEFNRNLTGSLKRTSTW